jgi:glycosyltransferase involved in cell wall biosynthesis
MSSKQSVGVVMCTYNGAPYVREQLESIIAQTTPPNELTVYDDGSSDGTLDIVERSLTAAPFSCRIVRNRTNLGYLRNFEQALAGCQADVIMLSDQDDWWYPNKVDKILAAFRADPSAGGVFSDAEIVDETLQPQGETLFQRLWVNTRERSYIASGHFLKVLLRRNVVCGATLALHRSWKDRVLPFPGGLVHDEWIAFVLAAHGALRLIPESLIRYRVHQRNQVGLPRMTWGSLAGKLLESRRPETERLIAAARVLREKLEGHAPPAALAQLDGKINHLQVRLLLHKPRLRRAWPITCEVLKGGYARYSSGWRSVIRDVISPI